MAQVKFWLLILGLALAAWLTACSAANTGDDPGSSPGQAQDDDNDDASPGDDDDNDSTAMPVDYIAVGRAALRDAVAPLLDYHAGLGQNVWYADTETIADDLSGEDLPAKIRAYLQQAYDPERLQFVQLVGANDQLPARWVSPDPNYLTEYTCLTDAYYSDLDSEFDKDGDGRYGEWDGDDINWTEEMYVGRLPYDDPETVAFVAEKIVAFAREDAPYKQTALLAAANIAVNGDGALVEEAIDQWVLDPGGYDAYRLYQCCNPFFEPDEYLTRETLLNRLVQHTPGFLLMTVHGNAGCAYAGDPVLCNTDEQYFDGETQTVMLSSGCSNGDLEELDSLGAAMLRSGAAAFLGSTTYTNPGYFGEGSLIFPMMVENTLNKNRPLGIALAKTRGKYMDLYFNPAGFYDIGMYWMNFYGFTLMGDPAMTYWHDKP
ncbi:MAG: hypothetical protein GX444_02220 [Myxococcales bacterium]|nr:hypothetical protein [Myxococcales bacterium]